MNHSENLSIKCTVDSCKYHDNAGYCVLNDITVGCCNSSDPHTCEQTECMSFEEGTNDR